MFSIIPLLLVFIGFDFSRYSSYHILADVKDSKSLIGLIFSDVNYSIVDGSGQLIQSITDKYKLKLP
jgi:hypothetical protein